MSWNPDGWPVFCYYLPRKGCCERCVHGPRPFGRSAACKPMDITWRCTQRGLRSRFKSSVQRRRCQKHAATELGRSSILSLKLLKRDLAAVVPVNKNTEIAVGCWVSLLLFRSSGSSFCPGANGVGLCCWGNRLYPVCLPRDGQPRGRQSTQRAVQGARPRTHWADGRLGRLDKANNGPTR